MFIIVVWFAIYGVRMKDEASREKVNKHGEQMSKDFKRELRYETALTTLAILTQQIL